MASSRWSDSFFPAIPVDQSRASHDNLLSFLAVCQESRVDILPITWQQGLGLVGKGGTASISQSQVNQQISFAFKRWDWDRFGPLPTDVTISEMYKAFISEIWILTRPRIHEQPSIINLEGICWEIPDAGVISPVLVFEKAPHGDLAHFILSRNGCGLSFFQRIDVCMQISKAIMVLHAQQVIHGDLKPENILVFETEKHGMLPKIADFGYSTLASGTDDAEVSLARSEPWCAPELHHRKFTRAAAKKTDIFSLGLLSLWVLFAQEILGIGSGVSAPNAESSDAMLSQSRTILKRLKDEGGLISFAENTVGKKSELDTEERSRILKYFRHTLEPDPKNRTSDLALLCRNIGLHREEEGNKHALATLPTQPKLFRELHPDFELSTCLRNLMLADHRVRDHIAKEILHECDRTKCKRCVHISMITTAIFYRIGFGWPLDVDSSFTWMRKAGVDAESLESEIEILRAGKNDRFYQNKKIKPLLDEVIAETLDFSQDTRSLELLERVYTRQLHDMLGLFGSSHYVVYDVKRTLALILNEKGERRRAADLMIELVQDDDSNPEYGPAHPTTITMRYQLSSSLLWLGSYEEAEVYAREASQSSSASLGPTHPLTLEALQVLAATYRLEGKLAKAQHLQAKIIKRKARAFGPVHPRTLQAKADLSEIYSAQCLWLLCQDILEEVSSVAVRDLGPSDPDAIRYQIQYATALKNVGRYDEAETALLRAKALSEEVYGPKHYATIRAMDVLSLTYQGQGRLCEAESLEKLVLEKEEDQYGKDAVELLSTKGQLAQIYLEQQRFEEAEVLLLEVVESSKAKQGDDHLDTLVNSGRYAIALAKQGHYDEAEELARHIMSQCKKKYGDTHPRTIVSMENLAEILSSKGRYQQAMGLERAALKAARKLFGKGDLRILRSMNNLANALSHLNELAKAKNLQLNALKNCRKIFGSHHPDTLTVMKDLSKVCIKQGSLEEARTLQLHVLRKRFQRSSVYSLLLVDDAMDLISTYLLERKEVEAYNMQTLLLAKIEELPSCILDTGAKGFYTPQLGRESLLL